MIFLLSLFWGVCIYSTAYLFFEVFLEPKPRWKPIYSILYIIALGVAHEMLGDTIEQVFDFYSVARFVLSISRAFVFTYLTTLPLQGSKKKKTALVGVFFLLGAVPEFPAMGLYTVLVQQPKANMADELTKDSIVTLAFMLTFLLVAIIRFFRQRNSSATVGKHLYWLELIMPVLSVVSVCYLISLQRFGFPRFDTLFISMLVLTICIVSFFVYGQYFKQARKLDLIAQEQKYKETHYRELEKHQAEIRAVKHDMANQLIAMNAYVQTGSAGRAGEEIRALIAQLEDSTKYAFTENAAINGLLAQKFMQAENEGILCDFRISLPAETGFTDTDLVALVGNILDNAIEACLHCGGQRYIRLEVDCQENIFILLCENRTDGRANSLKTRKRDAGRHGIGMQSIKQVVEKYNGDMKYSFGQDYFAIELSMFCSTLYKNGPG